MKTYLFLVLAIMSSIFSIYADETANYPLVTCPIDPVTVDWISRTKPHVYGEFGIAIGSTALAVSKVLPPNSEIYLFDFYDKVKNVKELLLKSGFSKVHACGNTYKLRDSYNWSLMKLLQKHSEPIFDYVYIDGMHSWEIDGFTFFLVDRLLKPGGYIDFDDYDWCMRHSPTLNPIIFPLTAQLYPDEQIDAKCINLVINLLVRRDPRYIEVKKNKIFQKLY